MVGLQLVYGREVVVGDSRMRMYTGGNGQDNKYLWAFFRNE